MIMKMQNIIDLNISIKILLMMMKIINLIEINMISTKGIMIRDHIKKKFHRSRIIES
jgi:hypothetical protein